MPGGVIQGSPIFEQLYQTMNTLLPPAFAVPMSAVIVVLTLTYLVTFADSAVLIINTINAAGDESRKAGVHIIFQGATLTAVIGFLPTAGRPGALQTAMIIGALPFSFLLALMGVAMVKALIRDSMRSKVGQPAV